LNQNRRISAIDDLFTASDVACPIGWTGDVIDRLDPAARLPYRVW
jgi:hypothetical protein